MGKKKEQPKFSTMYVTIPNESMMRIVELAAAEGVTSRVKAAQLLAGAVK